MSEVARREIDPTVVLIQEELGEVTQRFCVPNTLGQKILHMVLTDSAEDVRETLKENGLEQFVEMPRLPNFAEPSHASPVELAGSYLVTDVIVRNEATGKGKVKLPNTRRRTCELAVVLPGHGFLKDGNVFLYEQEISLWGVTTSEPPVLASKVEVGYGDTKMQLSSASARTYDPEKALSFLNIFSDLANRNM